MPRSEAVFDAWMLPGAPAELSERVAWMQLWAAGARARMAIRGALYANNLRIRHA
jgi:hypothetical protein